MSRFVAFARDNYSIRIVVTTPTLVGLVAQVGVTHFMDIKSPADTAIDKAVLFTATGRDDMSRVDVTVVSVVSFRRMDTVDVSELPFEPVKYK